MFGHDRSDTGAFFFAAGLSGATAPPLLAAFVLALFLVGFVLLARAKRLTMPSTPWLPVSVHRALLVLEFFEDRGPYVVLGGEVGDAYEIATRMHTRGAPAWRAVAAVLWTLLWLIVNDVCVDVRRSLV